MTKNKRSNRKDIIKGVVAATMAGLPMAGAFTIANPAIVALAEDQTTVCSIGGVEYETLEDAVKAAADGDTIKPSCLPTAPATASRPSKESSQQA